jgi:hypothetical protein
MQFLESLSDKKHADPRKRTYAYQCQGTYKLRGLHEPIIIIYQPLAVRPDGSTIQGKITELMNEALKDMDAGYIEFMSQEGYKRLANRPKVKVAKKASMPPDTKPASEPVLKPEQQYIRKGT